MECNVNKEIRNYREGIFMGLSMRQTIWGAVTIVVAAVTNFGLRLFIGKEPAMMLSVMLAAIPSLIGFLAYKGLTFEQFAVVWLRTNIKHAGWYVYRAVSIYDTIRDVVTEKEKHSRKNKKKSTNKRKDKNNVKKKKQPKAKMPTRPVRLPRSVQQTIPINKVFSDAIWQVGANEYSKTGSFTDINYVVASHEDQCSILDSWGRVLNSLAADSRLKISLVNRPFSQDAFAGSILMKKKDDGLNKYRVEMNRVIMDKAKGSNGIMQEKYLTLYTKRKNIEEARTFFTRAGKGLSIGMQRLSSSVHPLKNTERFRVIHDFFRPHHRMKNADVTELMQKGVHFADVFCPMALKYNKSYIETENGFARVLFIENYLSGLTDALIKDLMELPRQMILSIDIEPVNTQEAHKMLNGLSMKVESDITRWQQDIGLDTVLPYGLRHVVQQRTLVTATVSMLTPFSAQEIQQSGGICYGNNAVSGNLILANRASLLNGNGIRLGVSGGGKSFSVKHEISNVLLSTQDDILILDPEGEYTKLVNAFGGTMIDVSGSSAVRINALDMEKGYADEGRDPLADKSEFVLSLFEQILQGQLRAKRAGIYKLQRKQAETLLVGQGNTTAQTLKRGSVKKVGQALSKVPNLAKGK